MCYVHVTLVPFIGPSAEHKTKPTQHSVTALRSAGIQPHAIVCRSDEPISDDLERKISLLSNVPFEGVVNAPDANSLYEIPLLLHEEGLDNYICDSLDLDNPEPDLKDWRALSRPCDLSNCECQNRTNRKICKPGRRLFICRGSFESCWSTSWSSSRN